MHTGTIACAAELLLMVGIFAFGLNKYNKVALLLCFVASLNTFVVCFFIAAENPPIYIGNSRLLTKFAVEYLFLCGVVGIVACTIIAVRWMYKARQARLAQAPKSFRYKYAPHPFEKPQRFFSIKAESQSEADAMARVEILKLLSEGYTTMTTFYRA